MKLRPLATILIVATTTAWGQMPTKQVKPLDKVTVLGLLASGVTSECVAALVKQYGIGFEPEGEYLNTLRGAGRRPSRFQLGGRRQEKGRRYRSKAGPQRVSAVHTPRQAETARHRLPGPFPQLRGGYDEKTSIHQTRMGIAFP